MKEYKYLGILLTPSWEVNSRIKDLKSRASSALQLKRKLGENFKKYPDIMMRFFNALVKPIVLYMTDFWGCLKPPKNNPVDMTQVSFLKRLLGVKIQTPSKSPYRSLHRNLV